MNESLRILLVDDDDLDRKAARRALQATKLLVKITEAHTVASALAAFAQETFDCLILDDQLPDGDGMSVLHLLKEKGLDLPVIMLTGHGDEMVAVELMKAGASDYLTKSNMTSETLLRALQSVMRLHRAQSRAQDAETALHLSEERYRTLVSATSQIVWTTPASGEFTVPQPQWSAFTGQTFEELRGWGWLNAVHPIDRSQTRHRWESAIATHGLYEVEHRLRRHDGVYRNMLARAVPRFSEEGKVEEWVGIHMDNTERKEAELSLRFLERASSILASSLDYNETLISLAKLLVPDLADWCAIDLLEEDGTLRRVQTAHVDPEKERLAHELNRQYPPDPAAPNGPARVIQTRETEMVVEMSDALLAANARDDEHLALLRAGGLKSYICVPMTAREKTLGAITFLTAESGRRYRDADRTLAEELARRAAVAVDNARLFNEAQAQAKREALVNQIGRTLRGSLDSEEILRIATEMIGRELGVSRCYWASVDTNADRFEIDHSQYNAPGVAPISAQRSITENSPEIVALWEAGQSVAIADCENDPRIAPFQRPALRISEIRAAITCPVFLRGEWTGLFIVDQCLAPRVWTKDEVGMLCAVADMLLLALENARLYAHEHRVADMLQEAFLLEIPENMPGLKLGCRYRAGLDESHVGGDLYDAFLLSDGRVALVIADVSGKGLEAAVQTATVKYSLRAFANEAASPALVLRRLNRTLCNEAVGLGDRFVTLFYAVFDPNTGRLSYASAGHETQIIKREGGGTTLLNANGPILGMIEHRYDQNTAYLAPGDTLILYTDGLTEARAASVSGQKRVLLDVERVIAAIEAAPRDITPRQLAVSLENLALNWTQGAPQDDIALLIARRKSPQRDTEQVLRIQADPAPWLTELSEEPERELLFEFNFASRPECATEVRQAVAHWMRLFGFTQIAIEDFQTAVTEAVTNAVRHGSPAGPSDHFRVCAYSLPDEALAVEVADEGPGLAQPPSAAIPMPDPEALGGRGLPLIQRLSDSVTYPPSSKGHRVRMTKKPTASVSEMIAI